MVKRCRIVKIVRFQPSREVVISVFRSRDRLRVVCVIVINVRGTPSMIYTDLSTSTSLPESLTIVDPNPLCIFILFLGDRRAIFLFSTTFPNNRSSYPKLGTSQGWCPYSCTQGSFFGDDVLDLFSVFQASNSLIFLMVS